MDRESTQLITRLLRAARLGGGSARDELWEAVYQELRQLADAQMAREAPGRTLQPTALVNEVYLRLAESGDFAFDNRRHFFAAAARAMRRILVDDARRRGRIKRGGTGPGPQRSAGTASDAQDRRRRIPLDDCADAAGNDPDRTDALALEEALVRLERENEDLARVVELRYFAGLSVEQAADTMEIAPRTVEKYWRAARAWLHHELSDE